MLPILGVLGGIGAIIFVLVLVIKLIFNRQSPEAIISKYKGTGESTSIFIKKYPESNPDQYHSIFLRIGLVFSLALTIVAFSWTTYDRTAAFTGDLLLPEDFEIEPPPTKREPPPPPPPPPPEIKIVEDEEIIEDEPELEIEEIEEETVIDVPVIEEEQINEDEVFTIVEDMPVYPGGEEGLIKYLSSIPYPPIAKENDIEGSVYIRFVVDKSGAVTNVEIARGADKILNDAALNWVKKMPSWTPGKQRGKPVKVQFIVPLKFRLD